jgi:CheY-like chemotaxis protein
VKFTERGDIEVGAAREGKDGDLVIVRFWVRDTGVGIARDRIDHIFDEFAQADASLTREYEGTGLGLAICKRLVDAMGGTIWVESELGKGSTFSFTIRAWPQISEDADAQRGAEVTTDVATAPDIAATGARPLRLLLVEDNVVNRKVALAMLRNLGYDADIAADGLEAIAKIESAKIESAKIESAKIESAKIESAKIESDGYDAVFMDVQMPRLDGLEATREICRRWPAGSRPRIIGMTAHALDGDDEACFDAGMDDYMAKPVSLEKMSEVLSRVRPRAAAPPPVSV